MKNPLNPLTSAIFFAAALAFGLLAGCSGSGAVSPLTPAKANQSDGSTADSDVVYWVSFPVTITVTDPLNCVCLVNKKLGWACGNNGTILKWDGGTWARVESGYAKNENLLAVAFLSETEGWFVGSHGTILYYNNGQFSQPDSGTAETLYDVAVTRSRTVWVTGSNGTLMKFNGISWGTIPVTVSGSSAVTVKTDLYSLSLTDQNNGWAVGNLGTILKFDGQTWQAFSGSPTTERLNSVSVINEVQAWAVGAFGTILNFNGTTWNKMGSAFSGFDLYNIWMKDEENGWATGQDGTLIFYDGSRWISHVKPTGKPSLNSIAFSGDLGFIVGENGTILRFQPNGEMAKFDFLFRGEVAQKPTKAKPYYSINYTFQNQSPKTSPLATFELPLPQGFEMVPPSSDTPTPTPPAWLSGSTPTPSPTASPTPTATSVSTPSGTQTPGAGRPPPAPMEKKPASVVGEWKMKDNAMDLEVGTIASSELKSVNVLIRMKKDAKPDYPVVLKALLKVNDRVLSEAVPVTLLTKAPKPLAVEDEDQVTIIKKSPTPVAHAQLTPTEDQATLKKNPTPAANAQPSPTEEP